MAASADLYPGGRFGRYGVRLSYLGFDLPTESLEGLVLGGLIFEAAAARPRLKLELHVDGGIVTDGTRPTVGAGVQTQLWLVAPFGIGLDSSVLVIIDGDDTELMLTGALTFRIAG